MIENGRVDNYPRKRAITFMDSTIYTYAGLCMLEGAVVSTKKRTYTNQSEIHKDFL